MHWIQCKANVFWKQAPPYGINLQVTAYIHVWYPPNITWLNLTVSYIFTHRKFCCYNGLEYQRLINQNQKLTLLSLILHPIWITGISIILLYLALFEVNYMAGAARLSTHFITAQITLCKQTWTGKSHRKVRINPTSNTTFLTGVLHV